MTPVNPLVSGPGIRRFAYLCPTVRQRKRTESAPKLWGARWRDDERATLQSDGEDRLRLGPHLVQSDARHQPGQRQDAFKIAEHGQIRD